MAILGMLGQCVYVLVDIAASQGNLGVSMIAAPKSIAVFLLSFFMFLTIFRVKRSRRHLEGIAHALAEALTVRDPGHSATHGHQGDPLAELKNHARLDATNFEGIQWQRKEPEHSEDYSAEPIVPKKRQSLLFHVLLSALLSTMLLVGFLGGAHFFDVLEREPSVSTQVETSGQERPVQDPGNAEVAPKASGEAQGAELPPARSRYSSTVNHQEVTLKIPHTGRWDRKVDLGTEAEKESPEDLPAPDRREAQAPSRQRPMEPKRTTKVETAEENDSIASEQPTVDAVSTVTVAGTPSRIPEEVPAGVVMDSIEVIGGKSTREIPPQRSRPLRELRTPPVPRSMTARLSGRSVTVDVDIDARGQATVTQIEGIDVSPFLRERIREEIEQCKWRAARDAQNRSTTDHWTVVFRW